MTSFLESLRAILSTFSLKNPIFFAGQPYLVPSAAGPQNMGVDASEYRVRHFALAFFCSFGYNTPAAPGLAKFGIALGLGACNTPRVPAKSEIPGSLVKPQLFVPFLLANFLEHDPLPTCLTTTKKSPAKQPNISGFSEVWYRAWFGTKRPWVQVPQPGPSSGFSPQKAAEIAPLRPFHNMLYRGRSVSVSEFEVEKEKLLAEL